MQWGTFCSSQSCDNQPVYVPVKFLHFCSYSKKRFFLPTLNKNLTFFFSLFSAEFILHGLWINYANGGYPQNCAPNNKFSSNNLQSTLVSQMNCEWVSYTGSNTDFWSYEWDKHGTCDLSCSLPRKITSMRVLVLIMSTK
jgi:hypothetical protein